MLLAALMFGNMNDLDGVLAEKDVCKVVDNSDGNLYLLEGTQKLFQFTSEIHHEVESHYPSKAGIFSYIFKKLTERYNFDFIFIDMSPSPGDINQMASLSCDYILPTIGSGVFHVTSIDGLVKHILPEWCATSNRIHEKYTNMERQNFFGTSSSRVDMKIQKNFPKILPIIASQLELKNKKGEKEVTLPASHFIYTIQDFLNRNIPAKKIALLQKALNSLEHDSLLVDSHDEEIARLREELKTVGVGRKIEFVEYEEKNIIPFLPNLALVVSCSEEVGIPLAFLTWDKYRDYVSPKMERNGKRFRKISPASQRKFEAELAIGQSGWSSLAHWIAHITGKRRRPKA
jgi:hypothetical protein